MRGVFTHQCRVCGALFEAARFHARYCGPRCRKRISRAMRDGAENSAQAELVVREKLAEKSAKGR